MADTGKTITDEWRVNARGGLTSLTQLERGYQRTGQATEQAQRKQSRFSDGLTGLATKAALVSAAMAVMRRAIAAVGEEISKRAEATDRFLEAAKDLSQVTAVPRVEVLREIEQRGLFGVQAETGIFQAIASQITDTARQREAIQGTRSLLQTNTGLANIAQQVAQTVAKVQVAFGGSGEEAARIIKGTAAASPLNVQQLVGVIPRVAAAAGSAGAGGNLAGGLLARVAQVTGRPEEAGTLTAGLFGRLVAAPNKQAQALRKQFGILPGASPEQVLTGFRGITARQARDIGFEPTQAGAVSQVLGRPELLRAAIGRVRAAESPIEEFNRRLREDPFFRRQVLIRRFRTQAEARRSASEAAQQFAVTEAALEAGAAESPIIGGALEALRAVPFVGEAARTGAVGLLSSLDSVQEAMERNAGELQIQRQSTVREVTGGP